MVANAARIAHAAGREDDLRLIVKVDGTGFVAGGGGHQPREANGVDALLHQSHGLFVKAFLTALVKNAGGLHGQRAVHIDLEAVVALQATLCLDLPQKIQHLLGAAHRK